MTAAKVKTAEKAETQAPQDPVNRGQVVQFSPPRLPFHPAIEERFGIDKGAWKALVEAVFPSAKTIDAVAMVLSYCKARNLDPFKKPVHIVPMWSAAANAMVETVWPGIAELRTTAFRTKLYAGCDETEFGPMVEQTFAGKVQEWRDRQRVMVDRSVTVTFPEWARITVYREVHGKVCKFVGPKVKWLESYATIGNSNIPNEMWSSRPEGQLEKCAEAAALRKAFPEEIGGDLTAEEMHGRVLTDDAAVLAKDVTPKPPAPPEPPADEPVEKPSAENPEAPAADPEKPAGKPAKASTRKERQHAHAAQVADRAEGIPSAVDNPEGFLKWADERMAEAKDGDELNAIFNDKVEPRMTGMFPPDRDEVLGVFQKHERRLGGD